MNRRQILQRLEKGWRELHESLDGLSQKEMEKPVFDGGWSVKDLLGHLTTWEEEAIKAMDLMARGQPQPRYRQYGGIDGFNAGESEKKAGLSSGRCAEPAHGDASPADVGGRRNGRRALGNGDPHQASLAD